MPANSSLPPTRVLFARRLRTLRVSRGFTTARSFAVALKIDENRYTRYERGEVEPDLSLLVQICTMIGVSPNDLLLETAPGAGGFAEGQPVPEQASASSHTSNGVGRRRALAWQMAEEIVKLEAAAATGATDSVEKVMRISKVFSEINDDPFNYVARISASGRMNDLEQAAASRLCAMMEVLISASKDEYLG
jgi:transcriptional regulator with XRE-family HTH domain